MEFTLSETVLNVQTIAKQYKDVKAIDSLSFNVKRGEIFALLGPNGAGKTTTVRILNNIIKPDSGKIQYHFNGDSGSSLSAGKMGYLPEERGLYPDIKIINTLSYFGILHGMSKRNAEESAKIWLEKMGLIDRANNKLDTLSKGNQQKIQFISSILHKPDFAILDEPFSGLDPVNQDFFLDLISELRNEGMTIILSAHQMQMVERIADRIFLINKGQEVMQGTLDEIRSKHEAASKIVLKITNELDLNEVKNISIVKKARYLTKNEIELFVSKDESLNALITQISSKTEILNIQSERISLHDIFIQVVNGLNHATGEKS